MKTSKIKIAVVLFFWLSAVSGCSSTNPTNSNTVGATENGQPISVSAENLVGEYRENQSAADAKYNGKLLLVAGKVIGFAKGYSTPDWVSLGGGMAKPGSNFMLKGVGCKFTKDEQGKIGKPFENGTAATLVGRNAGIKKDRGAEYIVLENCEFR